VFLLGGTFPLPDWVASRVGQPQITIAPLGRELVPSEDQSRFVVTVICPVGGSIDYVDQMLAQGEDVLRGIPEVGGFLAAVSIRPGTLITEGTLFCRLLPKSERSKTQFEVMNEVRQRMSSIPGVRVVVLDLSTQGFTATRGFPIDFAVQGPDW